MFISKYKSLELKTRVQIVTAILTLLYISTLFMPFCDVSDFDPNPGENSDGLIVETFYVFETPLVFIYSFCFLLLAISYLSLNRYAVSLINPSVIIITLLVTFYLFMMLTWHGGPFRPDMRYGYWLNQGIIVFAIIKGYVWRDDFNATDRGAKNFKRWKIGLIVFFSIGIYWLFSNG